MNQCCIPGFSVSGLLNRCILFSLMVAGLYSCSFRDSDDAVKAVKDWAKSPFAGTWVSADSDGKTAFKLHIVQEADSLAGYYCLIKQDEGQSECQTPNAAHSGIAFSAKAPESNLFSTELYNLRHQILGHVQLTLTDSVLFWQLLRGPDAPEFMIRQTTFHIGRPLE